VDPCGTTCWIDTKSHFPRRKVVSALPMGLMPARGCIKHPGHIDKGPRVFHVILARTKIPQDWKVFPSWKVRLGVYPASCAVVGKWCRPIIRYYPQGNVFPLRHNLLDRHQVSLSKKESCIRTSNGIDACSRVLDAWDLWNLPILGDFGPCEDNMKHPWTLVYMTQGSTGVSCYPRTDQNPPRLEGSRDPKHPEPWNNPTSSRHQSHWKCGYNFPSWKVRLGVYPASCAVVVSYDGPAPFSHYGTTCWIDTKSHFPRRKVVSALPFQSWGILVRARIT
jgi:hypothetical protein